MVRLDATERQEIEKFAELNYTTISDYVRLAVGQRITEEKQDLRESISDRVSVVAPKANPTLVADAIIDRLGIASAKHVFELPSETQTTVWESLVAEALKQEQEQGQKQKKADKRR